MVETGGKGGRAMKGNIIGQPAAGIQINGVFNAKQFFETLAMIISNKENLSITVEVHEDGGKEVI